MRHEMDAGHSLLVMLMVGNGLLFFYLVYLVIGYKHAFRTLETTIDCHQQIVEAANDLVIASAYAGARAVNAAKHDPDA